MRERMMVFLLAIFLVIGPAVADEALSTTEATAIIKELADQARTTWLPAGTIVARHEEHRAAETTDEAAITKEIERQLTEYKSNPWPEVAPEWQKYRIEAIPFNARYWMSNAYTMVSTLTMHYDGSHFYCEREVNSRTDSVQVPPELKGNPLTEDWRMEWNGHRILAWDGQTYTTYDVAMNHVIAEPAVGTPAFIGGPFTAGMLPWGEGVLAEKSLAKADVSAVSVSRDGTTQTEMEIVAQDGSLARLTLDPSKDNAVTLATLSGRNGTIMQNRYFSGYEKAGDNWVPTAMLIEVRDAFTDRLISYDKWDFVLVDDSVPAPEAFTVDYNVDTRVQYQSPLASAVYNYSNQIDTEELLSERLEYVAEKSRQKPRNCATAALKYAASQLGKSVSDEALSALVGADGQTSLYNLKQTAQALGLYCRTVATNTEALRELTDCVAILYLPGQKHFVVLDRIDDRYVWLVDLASTKMYYRVDASLFPSDWAQGVALLISNRSIGSTFRNLSDTTAKSVLGAAEGWSCSYLLQEADTVDCVRIPVCTGVYRHYWHVIACESAPSGSCEDIYGIRLEMELCDEDASTPDCNAPDWRVLYYTWACEFSY